MANEVVSLTYEADVSALISALQRIPDVTAKEARSMVAELTRANKAATKKAEVAAKKVERSWRRSAKMAIKGWERFGKVIQGNFGEMIGRTGRLADIFQQFGPTGAIIGVALAGVTLFTTAIVGVGAAIYKSSRFAKTYIEEMKKLNRKIQVTAEELDAIAANEASWLALSRAAKDLSFEISKNLNVHLEESTLLLSAIAIQSRLTFTQWVEGKNLMEQMARGAAELSLHIGLALGSGGLTLVLQQWSIAAKHLDHIAEKLDMAGRFSGLIPFKIAEGYQLVVDVVTDWGMELLDVKGLMESISGLISDEAHALAEQARTEERRAKATAKRVAERKKLADQRKKEADEALALARRIRDARLEGERLLEEAGWARIRQEEEWARIRLANEQRIIDARLAGEEALEAAGWRLAEQQERWAAERARLAEQAAAVGPQKEQASWEDYARAFEGPSYSIASAFEAQADAAEEGSARQAKARKNAFISQKATALVGIAVATAAAMVSALKIMPPAGQIIAAIIAAQGAVQAGIVAAQQPPSYHSGGQIGRAGPNQPDEVMVRARIGEEILTRQQAQAPASLPALQIEQVYRHRAFGAFVADEVRAKRSPLRAATTRRSGRVGHRGRR